MIEIEYNAPFRPMDLGDWQLRMAKQIESNRGVPISDISREIVGTTLFVRVDSSLPSQAVENILSDIEDYLPKGSTHIETREV